MNNDLLPLQQAAGLLHIPAKWLRSEADAGRVPHIKAGARYLFELSSLTESLATRIQAQRAASHQTEVSHHA